MSTKQQQFDQFNKDLEPVVGQLNELMVKYGIYNPDVFMAFLVKDFKWMVFLNYGSFPYCTPENPSLK